MIFQSIFLAALETAAIIGIVVTLCRYVPYFYLLAWLTEIACVIQIIASDDNPDYKAPWLLLVLVVPVAGFMLYFLFYSRKLKPKYVKRLGSIKAQTYFPLGEAMLPRLPEDLKGARKFIYMEYFIIEEGVFWNSVPAVLKEKAAAGVDVKVVYDDIGCMTTLSGDYFRTLRRLGIDSVPFSHLKGNADSEFNNRSHRKITVVGGRIGTINLDYRSLAHHFENGVWMYRCESIKDLKADIEDTMNKSIEIAPDDLKSGLLQGMIRSVARIFAPLL